MSENPDEDRRLYKARRPDGEVAWVDHDELWRLQQSQAEELRRAQARRRRTALLALAGLAALALALLAYRLWPGGGSAPSPVAAVSEPAMPAAADMDSPLAATAAGDGPPAKQSGAAAETGAASPAAVAEPLAASAGGRESTAPAEASEPPAPPADANEPPGLELRAAAPPPPDAGARAAAAVRRWAAAWARQDVAAYLASYAAGFEPAEGLTRPDWERLRRRRLLDPASIQVEIESLEVVVRDEGRAEASFLQTYVSPDYSDVVRKSLLLVEETGEWRIAAERSEAPGEG